MFSTSTTANPNYLAKIVKINNLRKHSNADRLQITTIDGNNVITDLKTKDGDIYIFFPIESTINKEYLSWSNSFEEKTQNSNVEVKGFFNKHGRVRAISLRGEKSEGYIIPIDNMINWLSSKINQKISMNYEEILNQEFDSYKDVLICQKYVNVEALRGLQSQNKKSVKIAKVSKLIDNQFRFHIDTTQLRRNIEKISPEDTITITKKLHGTSFVVGKLLCNKRLNFIEYLLSSCGVNINKTEYQTIWSSRNVVKNGNRNLTFTERFFNSLRFYSVRPLILAKDILSSVRHPIKNIRTVYHASVDNHQHFYSYDLWEAVAQKVEHSLVEGITLYGEAVGYTKEGKYIQKPYDYGCSAGDFKAYIYRITTTNVGGFVMELSSQQIKEYCSKYNLNYVPEVYHGKAKDLFDISTEIHWHQNFMKALSETYLEKDCDLCYNKVPAEGIVVRKDSPLNIETYKHKSFRFLQHETEQLDKGEIDMETVESSEAE